MPCSKYMTPVLEHWNIALIFSAVSDCMPHSHRIPRHKFAYCVLERLNCFIRCVPRNATAELTETCDDKKCRLGKCQLFGQVTDLLQSFRLDLQSETLLLINIKELLMSLNGINQDMTTKNEEEKKEEGSLQVLKSPEPREVKRAVLWGLLFWH